MSITLLSQVQLFFMLTGLTLLVSMIIQAIFFIFAAKFQTDKVTDLSYALTFILLVAYWLTAAQQWHNAAALVMAGMVTMWGLRLGGFLFLRIMKSGKDPRFDGVREHFGKFARFWTLQGVAVALIVLPAAQFIVHSDGIFHKTYSLLGVTIFLLGLAIESLADAQKNRFRSNPSNKGRWVNEGLWKYSRHPNYFGELLVWWGVFVYVIPELALPLQSFTATDLAIIGPLTITTLILFVSGIPPLEKLMDKQYGELPEYQLYKKRTSALVPLPPRV